MFKQDLDTPQTSSLRFHVRTQKADAQDFAQVKHNAPKVKKRLQISPNNVPADNIVNEVDESAIDSSILVCERLSDESQSVKYSTGHELYPMIK